MSEPESGPESEPEPGPREPWATWRYVPHPRAWDSEADAQAADQVFAEAKRRKLQPLDLDAQGAQVQVQVAQGAQGAQGAQVPDKIRLDLDGLRARLAHLRATNQIPPYACWQGDHGETAGPAPEYQWNRAAIWFDFNHDFEFGFNHNFGRPCPHYRDVWVDLRDVHELGAAFDHVLLRAALAADAHHTLRAWRRWQAPRHAIARARGAKAAKALALERVEVAELEPKPGELEPEPEPDPPNVLLFQTTRGLEVTYFRSGHAYGSVLLPDQPDQPKSTETEADTIFGHIIAHAPAL